jgi:thioredoxin reductase
MEKHDVIVIGGGPSGLAFAAQLQRRGIKDVVVLEREAEAGGIPRHCGHWGFGWESHRRLMTGPDYAQRLRQDTGTSDVRTQHTVLEFKSDKTLRVHAPKSGIIDMTARLIVLATGARESTRAARLIGGVRAGAVFNTSTLQQLVYLRQVRPFSRPVIIGGEWVSFSALMTCRHAGIAPAAMLVEGPQIDAPWFFKLGARLRNGVPVHTATRVIAIHGGDSVEAVEVERGNRRSMIACDGVIVSGQFVHEDTLLKGSVKVTPSLIGNVQGKLKTAGRCVADARMTADDVARSLA